MVCATAPHTAVRTVVLVIALFISWDDVFVTQAVIAAEGGRLRLRKRGTTSSTSRSDKYEDDSIFTTPVPLVTLQQEKKENLDEKIRNKTMVISPTFPSSLERIIGGTMVKVPHTYPFMTMLVTKNDDLICGGSLIAPNLVLTAGHCHNPHHEIDAVIMGQHSIHDVNREEERIPVIDKWLHPQYTSSAEVATGTGIDFDFMLLKLQQSSAFSPIPYNRNPTLPSSSSSTTTTKTGANNMIELTTMGWGMTNSNPHVGTTSATTLHHVTVSYLDPRECAAIRDDEAGSTLGSFVTPQMICARDYRKGVCMGDSGGPLVMTTTIPPNRRKEEDNDDVSLLLVGVVSFGFDCEHVKYPQFYGRISAVSAWIDSHVCSNSPHHGGSMLTTSSDRTTIDHQNGNYDYSYCGIGGTTNPNYIHYSKATTAATTSKKTIIPYLTIEVDLDAFPFETYWTLKEVANVDQKENLESVLAATSQKVVVDGRRYLKHQHFESQIEQVPLFLSGRILPEAMAQQQQRQQQPNTETKTKVTTYQLSFYDHGNDGMCCDHGYGAFKVWWGNHLDGKKELMGSGGSFASETSMIFQVSTTATIDDDNNNGNNNNNWSYSSSYTILSAFAPSMPKSPPFSSLPSLSTSMPSSYYYLSFIIRFDSYPEEVGYQVDAINLYGEATEQLMRIPMGYFDDTTHKHRKYSVQIPLYDWTHRYRFSIFDKFADGVGTYQLWLGSPGNYNNKNRAAAGAAAGAGDSSSGAVLLTFGDVFGFSDSYEFQVQATPAPTSIPTQAPVPTRTKQMIRDKKQQRRRRRRRDKNRNRKRKRNKATTPKTLPKTKEKATTKTPL